MRWNNAAGRGLALTGALLLAVQAPAQRIDANRFMDLTLEVEGQMMSGRVPEGRTFRLVLGETDQFELMPVMAPGNGQRVILAVYRGVVDQPETRRLVERRDVAVGVPVTLRSHSGIRVVVDAIRTRGTATRASHVPSAPPVRPAGLLVTTTDQCCVCCGRACACACGVQMECGHCCVGECCDVIEPTSNEPMLPEILTQSRRFAVFSRGTCTRGSLFDRPRTPAPAAQLRTALR